MLSSVDSKVLRIEAAIKLLKSLKADYKETAHIVTGHYSFENAAWIKRDELIAQEQQRLEYYKVMQRFLS